MDTESTKDVNGSVNKPIVVASLDATNGEDDDSKSLLPTRIGGMSRKSDKGHKTRRKKVQWNDKNGNKLVQVLEYEPSDVSDSENGNEDSCMCTIL
ncbi:unnamed protein product [Lupinus luteus]|uniref:Uncharacterized protein n=1 Tax=Lupinus luteus TaxID=3873 RepID=A0AAV1VSJ1_LUPLU